MALSETKRLAIRFREAGRENLASLVNEVRIKMAAGVAPRWYVPNWVNYQTLFFYFGLFSYTREMLEQRDKYSELDDAEFNQQPGSLFAAGVDTSSSTLQSLVLALVLHPESQAKVHEELDRIVGQTRSPTWEDEPNLPYLEVGDISEFLSSFS